MLGVSWHQNVYLTFAFVWKILNKLEKFQIEFSFHDKVFSFYFEKFLIKFSFDDSLFSWVSVLPGIALPWVSVRQ